MNVFYPHQYRREDDISIPFTHSRQKQAIPSSGLAPYGTIPKYTDKKRKKRIPSPQEELIKTLDQQTCTLAPYPFFQSPSSAPSFLSTLTQKWFSNNKKKKKKQHSVDYLLHSPVGFIPPSVSPVALDLVSFCSVKGEVSPISNHPSSILPFKEDRSSDRKTAWNKCESVKIPCSKLTLQPTHDYSSTTSSHYYSTSKTASTLSEILCEHYVHQQRMMTDDPLPDDDDECPMTCPSLSPTSTTTSESTLDSSFSCTSDPSLFPEDVLPLPPTDPHKESPKYTTIDVPLATFRLFRELANDDTIGSFINNNNNTDNTGVITEPNPAEKESSLLENSWANWQEACLSKQWIPALTRPEERQRTTLQPLVLKSREPRANSAHLRILVAEVNMMRADKIVGPLRPRNYLPKRTDPLQSPPSPLSSIITAA